MFSILKDCKITRVNNSVSAGVTDQDSSRVDMQGFDSVIFIWLLGDVTSGSALTASVKSNAADSTSNSTTETTGTAISAGASDYDNKAIVLECHRPTLRYAYSTLVIDTQNAVVDGCIAIQFNGGRTQLPITQGSTVGQSTFDGPNA